MTDPDIAASHIPLDHPMILRAKEIVHALAPAAVECMWVAGSAAARWPEAYEAGGDVDIWVAAPNVSMQSWRLYQRMLSHVVETPETDYADGTKFLYNEDRLQIMLTHVTPAHLLNDFDILCHARAVNVISGEITQHERFTSQVRFSAGMRCPEISFQRALKFRMRYRQMGDRLFWEDYDTIKVIERMTRKRLISGEKASMLVLDGL